MICNQDQQRARKSRDRKARPLSRLIAMHPHSQARRKTDEHRHAGDRESFILECARSEASGGAAPAAAQLDSAPFAVRRRRARSGGVGRVHRALAAFAAFAVGFALSLAARAAFEAGSAAVARVGAG